MKDQMNMLTEGNDREDMYQYYDDVLKFLSYLLEHKDPHTAQDLTQDTFLKAYQKKEKYTPNTNLKAWLLTIAQNTFINHMRMHGRRPHITTKIYDTIAYSYNTGPQVLAKQDLLRCINQLPEKYVELFKMKYNEYPNEEIAKKLNIPLGTVKSRTHTAKPLLKKILVKSGITTSYGYTEKSRKE